MKKFIAFTLVTLAFSPHTCLSHNQEASMTRQWFNTKECATLEIKKYKSVSAHQIISSVTIEDTFIVTEVMDRIEKISAKGDMMISFGPNAEKIDLFFHWCYTSGQHLWKEI